MRRRTDLVALQLQLVGLREVDRLAAFRMAWRDAVLRVIWAQTALRRELLRAELLVAGRDRLATLV